MSDYIGTKPGEWKDINPSASEFYSSQTCNHIFCTNETAVFSKYCSKHRKKVAYI